MNTNIMTIYYQLIGAGLTKAGALGLMGNWMAESGCEANRLQGDFTDGRLLSVTYTKDVTAGRISRTQFARDQKGYGLAQWTYFSRKEALYDFWKNSGTDLGDVRMQVKFALHELSTEGEYAGLWSVLKTTDDIWTATDKVCRLYERPYYNNVDARFRYAKQLEAELEQIPKEPSGAGLSGQGGAAREHSDVREACDDPSSAGFPEASGKRDDPELVTTLWPPRTICNGMNGNDTAVLQAVLKARGWPVNYVDGAFGAYLEDIVKDFQKEAFPGEPSEWDGIVGPKTWGKLLER